MADNTTVTTLWEALLAFQSEGIALQKNAINPHFKNKYISLDQLMEQVLPILNKNGLVLLQMPTTVGGEPGLSTSLTLASTGESIEATMPLILGKSDPQGQGSAITYARRYALMSILGLVADEDDDGTEVTTSPASKATSGRRGRKTASDDTEEANTPKF